MKDFSFVTGPTPAYIESLYSEFAKDSTTVDPEWKKFFEGFDFAVAQNGGSVVTASTDKTPVSSDRLIKELGVFELIRSYRKRGHLVATTNPIRARKDRHVQLELDRFNLSDADLESTFFAGNYLGLKDAKLKDIIVLLKKLYTSNIGIEYTYINDTKKCQWVQKTYSDLMQKPFTLDERKRILEKLNEGVIFEKFLSTKFIGQKRFGLEGGENTIPALDRIINDAADAGVQEVVIGMAHRGRLNILTNTLKKTYEQVFSEFE
ncbi:MAG: 2-oxoglutarate dehydrogenase component, partial [Flavipsychrobacter sp.]|nr:2-oxoglutarate dehydrogenase component [Flavipsychrobacter sp.]